MKGKITTIPHGRESRMEWRGGYSHHSRLVSLVDARVLWYEQCRAKGSTTIGRTVVNIPCDNKAQARRVFNALAEVFPQGAVPCPPNAAWELREKEAGKREAEEALKEYERQKLKLAASSLGVTVKAVRKTLAAVRMAEVRVPRPR